MITSVVDDTLGPYAQTKENEQHNFPLKVSLRRALVSVLSPEQRNYGDQNLYSLV